MCLNSKDAYQIVFLIDLNITELRHYDDSSLTCVFESIKLSVIKILTHFGYKLNDNLKTTNISWGYTLFNQLPPIKKRIKSTLIDYSLNQIKTFENDLRNAFNEEQQKWASVLDNSLNCEVHDEGFSEDGAILLERALTEVLSDFQWDRPDISSPLRPLRRDGKAQQHNKTEMLTKNYVMLLSRCPHSKKELRTFLDSKDLGSNAVLESFMPSSLHRQFYQETRIHLFWLDLPRKLTYNELPRATDFNGLSILHSVLGQLEGGVIPYAAMLNLGMLSTVTLQHYVNPTDEISLCDIDPSSNLVLPLSIVLNFYTTQQLKKFSTEQSAADGIARLCVVIKDKTAHPMGQLWLSLLTTNGMMTRCSTDYVFDTIHVKRNSKHNSTANHSNSDNDSTLDFNMDITSHLKNTDHTPPKVERFDIFMLGVLPSGGVPLDQLESQNIYLAVQHGSQHWLKGFNLSQILLTLAKRKQVMLVKCTYTTSFGTHLAILQPLTSVCATLSILKSTYSPIVNPHSIYLPEFKWQEDVCQFVKLDDNVSFLQSFHLSRTSLESSNVTDPQISNTSQSTNRFDAAMLEQWYEPGCLQSKPHCIARKLQKNSEDTKRLRHLQKYYLMMESGKLPKRKSTATSNISKKSVSTPTKAGKISRKTPMKRSVTKSPMQTFSGISRERRGSQRHLLTRSRSYHGTTSNNLPVSARTQRIIAQSQIQKYEDDLDGETEGRQLRSNVDNKKSDFIDAEFSDETSFIAYLSTTYNDAIAMVNVSAQSAMQALVSLAVRYVHTRLDATHTGNNPQMAAQDYICKHLLTTNKLLQQKYKDESDIDSRIRECELQTYLFLETESLYQDSTATDEQLNDKVQEVVSMLRAMSFLKDSAFLSAFLNDLPLDQYSLSIPRILGQIYDELLHPLPAVLSDLLSPTSSDLQSMNTPLMSNSSSIAPSSHKSHLNTTLDSVPGRRALRRKKSMQFNNIPSRQISIPNAKVKKNNNVKMKTRSSARKRSSAKPKDGAKCEIGRIRRNLFDDESGTALDRRKSIAVMESVKTSRLKTPQKRQKVVARSQHTPKAHHILKTKVVSETPVHKQRANSTWRRQERKRTATLVDRFDTTVIQESPDKALHGFDHLRRSPRRHSTGTFQRRDSFYKDGPQSRSCQQYLDKLEQRMTQKSPLQCILTSPRRRIRPLALFAGLASPSPVKTASRIPNQMTQTPSKDTQATPSYQTPRRQCRSLFMTPTKQPATPSENNVLNSPCSVASILKSPFKPNPEILQYRRPRKVSFNESPAKLTSIGDMPYVSQHFNDHLAASEITRHIKLSRLELASPNRDPLTNKDESQRVTRSQTPQKVSVANNSVLIRQNHEKLSAVCMSPTRDRLLSLRLDGIVSNVLNKSLISPQQVTNAKDASQKRECDVQSPVKRLRTTLLSTLSSEQFDNDSKDSGCSSASFVFKSKSFTKRTSTFSSMDSTADSPGSPNSSTRVFSMLPRQESDVSLYNTEGFDSVEDTDASQQSVEFVIRDRHLPAEKPSEKPSARPVKQSEGSTPQDKTTEGRNKFSPNVTAKSLSHLINSPLLNIESVSPSTQKKTQQKSSRRSLYRAETQSNIH